MSQTGANTHHSDATEASNVIEERLRLIVDTIPTIVWSKLPDGSADFLNREFREYTGLSLEHGLGWGWMNAFHPDDRLMDEWRAALAAEKPFEKEARLRRADGQYRWFLIRAVPLRDEQRNIVKWYGTTSDIEDLKRAEDRIRLVINTIPTIAWTVRPDGVVDFVNQRWLDYAGLSLEEQIEDPTCAVHPEDLPRIMKKWLADMAAGEPFEDEMRLRRADGEYRWFLVRTAPLRDEQGNLLKWYGVSIDIEDRKRAESQSRTLLDAIPQQIWSGPSDGTLDYCNERWRSYMGLGLEELQGDGWQSMIHPDDRERVLEAWREAVTNGTPYEQEERHRGADGRYRWFLARGMPLRDADARIVRWYGTNTDIEDLRRAEDARRQIEEQHRIVVETASDAVVSIDENSKILFVSPATIRIFAYESSELIGQPLTMLMPGFMSELHEAGIQRYLATGQRHINWQGTELVGLRKNGEEFPVEVSFGEASKERRHVFTGFIRDITERKRSEEELRRLSGQLLRLQDEERRKIARDLHDSTGQNLVALTTSLAQLQASIPSTSRKSRKMLLESQSLADQCIREVRTLSYLLHPPMLEEAGLEDAIRLFAEGFTKRSAIQVEVEVSPEFGRLDREAELTLFRVVQESLTNIRRHSGSLRAKIRIDRNPGKITLEVSDKGSGISGNLRRRNGKLSFGLGVGIPSMHERVKLIGGQLDIESNSGGTTVRVTIPVDD